MDYMLPSELSLWPPAASSPTFIGWPSGLGAPPADLVGMDGMIIDVSLRNSVFVLSVAYSDNNFILRGFDLAWRYFTQLDEIWSAYVEIPELPSPWKSTYGHNAIYATWITVGTPPVRIGAIGVGPCGKKMKKAFAMACAIVSVAGLQNATGHVQQVWHPDVEIHKAFDWCVRYLRWSRFYFSRTISSGRVKFSLLQGHQLPWVIDCRADSHQGVAVELPEITPELALQENALNYDDDLNPESAHIPAAAQNTMAAADKNLIQIQIQFRGVWRTALLPPQTTEEQLRVHVANDRGVSVLQLGPFGFNGQTLSMHANGARTSAFDVEEFFQVKLLHGGKSTLLMLSLRTTYRDLRRFMSEVTRIPVKNLIHFPFDGWTLADHKANGRLLQFVCKDSVVEGSLESATGGHAMAGSSSDVEAPWRRG
jgi:hypothetical protein